MSEPIEPGPLSAPSPEPTAPDAFDASAPVWLAAVLAGVGEALVLTDARDRVTTLNPAAEALTGWPASEATGRGVDEVLPGLGAAFAGAAGPVRAWPCRDRAGRERRVEVRVTAVGRPPLGRVVALRPPRGPGASPAGDDEDRLERFAHQVVHDLRSPIHAVVMMAELLGEDAGGLLPEAERAMLDRIIDRLRGLDGQVRGLVRAAAEAARRRGD